MPDLRAVSPQYKYLERRNTTWRWANEYSRSHNYINMPIEPKPEAATPIVYDPHKNMDAISIIKQADGNYIAEGQRFGKIIKIRGAAALIASTNHRVPALPDPVKTPGAINTAITQANIQDNICNPNWSTKSERPASSYTTQLKIQQLAVGYTVNGDTKTADYEEDHLISLELGGNPTDPNNLWPESYLTTPNAHDKDKVENWLHAQVCSGAKTLAQAQQEISINWLSALNEMNGKPAIETMGASPIDPSDE